MTKVEVILLKAFRYSLEPIGYDFEKLTAEEKVIYESQSVINVLRKEVEILGC